MVILKQYAHVSFWANNSRHARKGHATCKNPGWLNLNSFAQKLTWTILPYWPAVLVVNFVSTASLLKIKRKSSFHMISTSRVITWKVFLWCHYYRTLSIRGIAGIILDSYGELVPHTFWWSAGNIGKYWEISRYLPFGSGARIDIAMKNKYNSTVWLKTSAGTLH